MSKKALILFGDLRTGLNCCSSLKRFLYDVDNLDIYIGLWNSSNEIIFGSSWDKRNIYHTNYEQYRKYIDKIRLSFPLAGIKESLFDREDLASFCGSKFLDLYSPSHISQKYMFASIRNGISLMRPDIIYQDLLITRPDVYFRGQYKERIADIDTGVRIDEKGMKNAYDIIMQCKPDVARKIYDPYYQNQIDPQSSTPFLDNLDRLGISANYFKYKWGRDFWIRRPGLQGFINHHLSKIK